MSDDVAVEILFKWKQQDEQVLAQVQSQLVALTAQTAAANAATQGLNLGLLAAAPAWLQVAAAVAVAAILLAPISAMILSIGVAFISFTAGAAGFAAVVGGAALGFGLLAAAITMLGVAGLGGMSATSGPVAKLVNDFNAMKTTLEQQAAPLATVVILWADKFLPAITAVGQAVMTWFGERLPSVLRGIGQIFSDLSPTFNNFGIFLGATFDRIGRGGLGAIFEDFARFGIAQLQGLITNLVRLSDWFQKELPGLKPIMESVFGFLGTVLQGVAIQWATLTDWVIANWPQTVADAKIQVEKLSGAFKDLSDPNGNLQSSVQGFIELGKSIKGISDAVTSALVQLGQLNTALQPIADLLNSIESALGGNAAGTRRAIISQPSFASDPGYNVNPRNPTGRPGVINNYVNVQSTGNPAADGALIARALRAGFTQ